VLWVHSSLKSLGPVDGGAATVIAALEEVLGEDGLLLMPSFNLVEGPARAPTWQIDTTPSTVGWITEYFRRMPGTIRSDHYSHSVAARGRNAAAFVGEHRAREGMISPWDLAPWGYTYGSRSPMIKAADAGGKLLMLGVNYHSATYLHVVEVMWWNRAMEHDPHAPYRYIHRDLIGEQFWDQQGHMQRGNVGDADSRLFPIRPFLDEVLQFFSANPEAYSKIRQAKPGDAERGGMQCGVTNDE